MASSGVPIDLLDESCTSESPEVSGHDASRACERKGWRVLKVENENKMHRLTVTLPSPARLHSIQLNTTKVGRIAMWVVGAESGPNNYVGQANVGSRTAASTNTQTALEMLALPPLDQAKTFTVGKGEGRLSTCVAQTACEKLIIAVAPQRDLAAGETFGISRLEILRQLSDAEAQAVRGASAAAAAPVAAPPRVPPVRPVPPRPQPAVAPAPPPAADEPAPTPRPGSAPPARAARCGCEKPACHGCGPKCRAHGQPSRLARSKKGGKPFWVCPLPSAGCGYQRDATETLGAPAAGAPTEVSLDDDDDDDDGLVVSPAAASSSGAPPAASAAAAARAAAAAAASASAADPLQAVLARQKQMAARAREVAGERERERAEARAAEKRAAADEAARPAREAAAREARRTAAAAAAAASGGGVSGGGVSGGGATAAATATAAARKKARRGSASPARYPADDDDDSEDASEMSPLARRPPPPQQQHTKKRQRGDGDGVGGGGGGGGSSSSNARPGRGKAAAAAAAAAAKGKRRRPAAGGGESEEEEARMTGEESKTDVSDDDSATDVGEETETEEEEEAEAGAAAGAGAAPVAARPRQQQRQKRQADDEEDAEEEDAGPPLWPSSAPPCRYGAGCYQQNPKHIGQFGHSCAKLLSDVDGWSGLGGWKAALQGGGLRRARMVRKGAARLGICGAAAAAAAAGPHEGSQIPLREAWGPGAGTPCPPKRPMSPRPPGHAPRPMRAGARAATASTTSSK